MLAAVLVTVALTLPAAKTEPGRDVARAAQRRMTSATAIRLDGELTEEVWQTAPVITGFKQRDPNDGAAATYETEARIAYDATALYIAVLAHRSRACASGRHPHAARRILAVGLDQRR